MGTQPLSYKWACPNFNSKHFEVLGRGGTQGRGSGNDYVRYSVQNTGIIRKKPLRATPSEASF